MKTFLKKITSKRLLPLYAIVAILILLLIGLATGMLSQGLQLLGAAFAAEFDSCATAVGLPQPECEALVAFYNSTNGTGWIARTGWLETNEPCQWYGIFCDSEHVTSIYSEMIWEATYPLSWVI